MIFIFYSEKVYGAWNFHLGFYSLFTLRMEYWRHRTQRKHFVCFWTIAKMSRNYVEWRINSYTPLYVLWLQYSILNVKRLYIEEELKLGGALNFGLIFKKIHLCGWGKKVVWKKRKSNQIKNFKGFYWVTSNKIRNEAIWNVKSRSQIAQIVISCHCNCIPIHCRLYIILLLKIYILSKKILWINKLLLISDCK